MIKIIQGDCLESLKKLEDQSINTCITSPPYWGLRDYNGEDKQLGLEETPEEFVKKLSQSISRSQTSFTRRWNCLAKSW